MSRPDADDRETVETIAAVSGVLADDATWAQPPPELADAIMARIALEPTPLAARRRRWTRPLLGTMAAVAAAVLIVVGVVVTDPFSDSDDGTGTVQEVALAGTELAPNASATAELRDTPTGVSIMLDVSGLDPAALGFYYQAWVKGPAGLVAIGTFHMRGDDATADDGPIELWSGVDLAQYPDITVTLEPEDGNPASSGQRVLAGTVPAPTP
jgi:hypothetical protein